MNLDDLPIRAQIGYVLKYGNTDDDIEPATVVGILSAKGVLREDPDEALTIAEDVFERRGLL